MRTRPRSRGPPAPREPDIADGLLVLGALGVTLALLGPPGPIDAGDAGVVFDVRLEELEGERFRLLPGVGPVLAERLEAARSARGGPLDIDAADAVPGVGPVLRSRWESP